MWGAARLGGRPPFLPGRGTQKLFGKVFPGSYINWNGTRMVTGQIFANQPVSIGNGRFDGSNAMRAGVNFNAPPPLIYRPPGRADLGLMSNRRKRH